MYMTITHILKMIESTYNHTYTIKLPHFQISDEKNAKGDKQMRMV